MENFICLFSFVPIKLKMKTKIGTNNSNNNNDNDNNDVEEIGVTLFLNYYVNICHIVKFIEEYGDKIGCQQ